MTNIHALNPQSKRRATSRLGAVLRRLAFCAASLGAGLTYGPGMAWADASTEALSDAITKSAANKEYGFGKGSFVVAPIPFKNSLIGAGLALGAGYLFQLDPNSDTSIVGLGTMRSENGSSATAVGASLAFNNNRWQMSVTAGEADVNYDIYLGSIPVPIRQTGQLVNTTLFYGVTPEIHFGGGFRYIDTAIAPAFVGGTPPPDSNIELAIFSLMAKWDTRDDSFSARNGHLLDVRAQYGDVLNTSGRSYQKAFANFSIYRPITAKHSFAARLSACAVNNNAPFFDKCSLGGTDSMRGFTPTRYLDNALLSAQTEYRHQLGKRFSAVLFGGLGMTGASFDTLNDGGLHAAGGLGLRYQLSKKFKAAFSVDASLNDEGEQLIYIYVGQRF